MQTPPPPEFKYQVSAESDGKPLAGVTITRAGTTIGTTDATGKALMTFQGREGDTFDLRAQCPDGYATADKPIGVRLSKLSDEKIMGEVVSCQPLSRKVVVAIRAEGGSNLPVKYLGREIARTDTSGAATVMLMGSPGEAQQLTLDTTEKGNERLQPQNPSLTVMIPKDHDDVVSADQKFELRKIKVVVVQRQVPHPVGPQPLH